MAKLATVVCAVADIDVKGLWYLATPYAKYPFGKDTAARHASQLAAALMNNGVKAFSPIAHGHTIQLQGAVQGHDWWLAFDERIMATCAGIIVARMPGYHFSKGVEWETKWFQERGLPVLYLDVVEILGIPEIFNDENLAAEVEAKIMGEKQPLPETRRSQDKEDQRTANLLQSGWIDRIARRERMNMEAEYPSDDGATYHCGDPDCEACGAIASDPREGREYRKERPVASGVVDYFPLALAEVARISVLGNRQHNIGDDHLHWERTKSNDHADCIVRHLSDRGGNGLDGAAHSANLAWRALALLQEEEEDKLLKAGVRPENVFARAHTFNGKTAAEFWTPVPRPKDWQSRPQSWVDAANEYWGKQEQATAAQWSEAEIAAMSDGRAPSEAYKFNKVPKFIAKAQDWTAQVERHERVCGPSDGEIYKTVSRRAFSDEDNAALDRDVQDKANQFQAFEERELKRQASEKAAVARERAAKRTEVGQVLYKPARLYVYMNDGHFEQVPDTYSGTAVERAVVREDGLDYQGVVRT